MESSASKPWLTQAVPYLSKSSGKDLCLKQDGVLCVVYVVKDASSTDQQVIDAFENVKESFTPKIERGIRFNFMRLDVSAEPEFASTFKLEDD